MASSSIRFAAVGLSHGHIHSLTGMMNKAGATCAAVFDREPQLLAEFARHFPGVPVADSLERVLEDSSVQVIVSAAVPCERAELAVKAMRHGKDVLLDKPGATTLAQLAQMRQAASETGRLCVIYYGERLENPAAQRACELMKAGAIGRVVHTVGLGPHSLRAASRPAWFFRRSEYGGILTDIASHQCDFFLYLANSTWAKVTSAYVANVAHPEYPQLQDLGQATLQSETLTGQLRVDWLSPAGLPTWGDGRRFILGTDGYIEIRQRIEGQSVSPEILLVDKEKTSLIDCRGTALPFGKLFVEDVQQRTQKAMTLEHSFAAMALALEAQEMAERGVAESGR